jgi:hypothetical protein
MIQKEVSQENYRKDKWQAVFLKPIKQLMLSKYYF